MGNNISFDGDEIYFKFAIFTDDKLEKFNNVSKYVSWSEFHIESFKALLGKIFIHDLFGNLFKDETEMKNIRDFVQKEFVKDNEDEIKVYIVGNGYDTFKEEINAFFGKILTKYQFRKQKLTKSLIKGLLYVRENGGDNTFYKIDPAPILELNKIKEEEYTPDKRHFHQVSDVKYDLISVNIRGGISYYKINEEEKFERVSGSIIGESTFVTLVRLLTGYENIMEAMNEAMKGDFRSVDMTVGDIYGGSCSDLGLPEDLIASSMGKAQYIKDKSTVPPQDMCKSVLVMFCINIGVLTNLVADSFDVKTIVIQGIPHLGFQKLLATVFNVYNKNGKDLFFIEHGEFLGCIGTKLNLQEFGSMTLDI